MQMLNDSLRRHMLQRGTFWLAPPQAHPQQGGGDSGGLRQQNLVAPTIIHSLGGPPGYPHTLTNQSHPHLLSFQRPAANHAPTSGRVRAPISPVPSGIPLHEALQQQRAMPPSAVATATTPGVPVALFGGGGGASLGLAAHHHGKHQSLATPPTGSAPLPSQRVT